MITSIGFSTPQKAEGRQFAKHPYKPRGRGPREDRDRAILIGNLRINKSVLQKGAFAAINIIQGDLSGRAAAVSRVAEMDVDAFVATAQATSEACNV